MRRLYATVALLAGLTVSGCASWMTLFDGGNLNQWYTVGDANWRIEGDSVVADKLTGKRAGFLVTNRSYRDFHLKLEFWASDDANSGIYMRCGNPEVLTDKICYEANIFDQRKDPTYGTGALVHRSKVDPMPKAGGKWNTYDITVKGDHIVVVLNGQKTVDIRNTELKEGRIGLQYAQGVIRFRNIQIRELD
jgi:hypothetical protein